MGGGREGGREGGGGKLWGHRGVDHTSKSNFIELLFERLPKPIFYGELQAGARSHGSQKKDFKNNLNASMNDFHVNLVQWQILAQDRPT